MAHLLILAASSGQNFQLAKLYADCARTLELDVSVIALADLQLPLFCIDDEKQGPGPHFSTLSQAAQSADAFVVCAPEYNGSMPPVLTNAIAWLSRSAQDFRAMFNGKPAVLATHSGGGGQKVLMSMRQQLSHLGCTVLGRDMLATRSKPPRPETIHAQISLIAKLLT